MYNNYSRLSHVYESSYRGVASLMEIQTAVITSTLCSPPHLFNPHLFNLCPSYALCIECTLDLN